MKKIVCILLTGILVCMTLTAGFAKDEISRIAAADMRDGAADFTKGAKEETNTQTLEVLWIDEGAVYGSAKASIRVR